VENCRVRGGIFHQAPAGFDGQGEFPHAEKTAGFGNCTWGLSLCQTQMRLLRVETCDFFVKPAYDCWTNNTQRECGKAN